MGMSSGSSIWIVVGCLLWIVTADLFVTSFLNDPNVRTTRSVIDTINNENVVDSLNDNLTISIGSVSSAISQSLTPFQVFWKALFFQLVGLPKNVIFFAIQLPVLIMIVGIIDLIRNG